MLNYVHISPIYTLTSYHSHNKIYTGITPTLCLDTKNITQHLARFNQINLGRPLVIPHFCLALKLIKRSKCYFNWWPSQFLQRCPGQTRGRDKRVYISTASLGQDNCRIKLVPPQEVVLTYPGITLIFRINYPVYLS